MPHLSTAVQQITSKLSSLVQQKMFMISHSFCGSGIRDWLGWSVLAWSQVLQSCVGHGSVIWGIPLPQWLTHMPGKLAWLGWETSFPSQGFLHSTILRTWWLTTSRVSNLRERSHEEAVTFSGLAFKRIALLLPHCISGAHPRGEEFDPTFEREKCQRIF